MKFIIPFLILCVITLIALFSGRYNINLHNILMFSNTQTSISNHNQILHILLNIRLPRVMAAILIGGALASSGTVYQAVFRNPMASPSLLGASAGAAFGAAFSILLGLETHFIQIVSFLGGLLAVFLSTLLASSFSFKEKGTIVLVLAGMVISALFSSFLSLIKYIADPYNKLPDITFWLLGRLSNIEIKDIIVLSICTFIGLLFLFPLRWKINILSLNNDEAKSLGINPVFYQIVVLSAATLMTSAAVSVCGLIGWVGLIIPHIARLIFGPDFRSLLPGAAIMGSIFMVAIDTVSRSLLPQEIPLGILTALLGGPFFVFIMLKLGRSWN